MKNTPKRILIFNVNWLGDVLFSTAVVRNIRYHFPDSFIASIVPSRCYPVLKDNPHLDEIIIFDEKDRHTGLWAKIKFIQDLKRKKFDKVFLLHRSFSRALICWLSNIPERVGYDTKKRGFLLTKKIIPPDPETLHRIDYYLNIIDKDGLKIEDRYTEFFVTAQDQDFADGFLKANSVDKNDFLVGINPGGNWLLKRWPKEYWVQLLARLINELKAKVIITGSHSDLALANEITQLSGVKPIISCGKLNLKQSAALYKRLNLFITADSGPMHIANAVGASKIIALFGPTSALLTGPYPDKNVIILQKDVGCSIPCYKVNCSDNRCMKAITCDDILREIK